MKTTAAKAKSTSWDELEMGSGDGAAASSDFKRATLEARWTKRAFTSPGVIIGDRKKPIVKVSWRTSRVAVPHSLEIFTCTSSFSREASRRRVSPPVPSGPNLGGVDAPVQSLQVVKIHGYEILTKQYNVLCFGTTAAATLQAEPQGVRGGNARSSAAKRRGRGGGFVKTTTTAGAQVLLQRSPQHRDGTSTFPNGWTLTTHRKVRFPGYAGRWLRGWRGGLRGGAVRGGGISSSEPLSSMSLYNSVVSFIHTMHIYTTA